MTNVVRPLFWAIACGALFVGPIANSYASSATTDLSEDAAPKFTVAVDINGSSQPSAESAGGTERIMTDASGRRFRCQVPKPQQSEARGPSAAESPQQEDSPSQLLGPLASTCLFRTEDWWTYEICPGKHVRQFHLQGTDLLSQYQLGSFDASATDLDKVLEDDTVTPASKYVREVFSKGEACDLTSAHRSSEVHYTCGEAREGIQHIREPATCTYLFTVATPRLCNHSSFRTKEAPAGLIACRLDALGEGNTHGFGGPLKIQGVRRPDEVSTVYAAHEDEHEEVALWARPFKWVASHLGMWSGVYAAQTAHPGDEDPEQGLVPGDEEGVSNGQGEGEGEGGAEMDPEAIQALADELTKTIMAAFGTGGEQGEHLDDDRVAEIAARMQDSLAQSFAEHSPSNDDEDTEEPASLRPDHDEL